MIVESLPSACNAIARALQDCQAQAKQPQHLFSDLMDGSAKDSCMAYIDATAAPMVPVSPVKATKTAYGFYETGVRI